MFPTSSTAATQPSPLVRAELNNGLRVTMMRLTPEGKREIETIAARHAVPSDVAKELFEAVVRGGGAMAQFNIAALGGSGQWMRSGMTMVSDMFNHSLKAKVASLCEDLASLAASSPFEREVPPSRQEQRQGARAATSVDYDQVNVHAGAWWPEELGSPTATGSQNDARYAYFPAIRRLVVEIRGKLQVYDSGDHRITGFGQQQSGSGSMTFSSQHGLVALSSLPKVERRAPSPGAASAEPERAPEASVSTVGGERTVITHDEILSSIERLAALHKKGHLTEAEFQTKKTELLARL